MKLLRLGPIIWDGVLPEVGVRGLRCACCRNADACYQATITGVGVLLEIILCDRCVSMPASEILRKAGSDGASEL